jgi:CHAT domain-containing protein
VERLLIIPLGICSQLPYAAATLRDGSHLIDHTDVTLAPTHDWARAAKRPRPPSRDAASSVVAAFHPGDEPYRLDLAGDITMAQEVLHAHPLLSPTADQVLARLIPDTAIGHFSCHGSYNHTKPLDSALHLRDDLTLNAVLAHGQAPWLVNLSACETAIPDLNASEQAISFPTAFLQAGTAHVIANLWSVGNHQATTLNRTFYAHLNQGTHPTRALRLAQQALRGSTSVNAQAAQTAGHRHIAAAPSQSPDTTTHPYWWAAFTHHGNPW